MAPHPVLAADPAGRIFLAGRAASLSSQMVAEVREALFARKLKPGDFLGTEKDLAERFGTSRIVARDALRTLEALGVVAIKMGKGGGRASRRAIRACSPRRSQCSSTLPG
jgi:DNA-binding FadR family transcriptional regulator